MTRFKNKKNNFIEGFTLIELLIVIAIIGILASIVIATVNSARTKAEEAKATLEMKNLKVGLTMLENDTNKWPNGCPIDAVSNPEVNLIDANAGILKTPTIFSSGACAWTAYDISRWRGPYSNSALDGWGNSYVFDPDYHVCVNNIDVAYPVLVSYGENGVQNYPTSDPTIGAACTLTSSDDIYIKLIQ